LPELTFKDARPWAKAIKTKVMDRSMPPWFADPAHGTFTNDRSMSTREIDVIRRWVDGGAAEGDPRHAPQPVVWPENGWQIKPDHIVSLPDRAVPARGTIEWESLALPFPVKHDVWLTSVEILAGEPSVVHHICFSIEKHNPATVYGRYEWQVRPRDAKGVEVEKSLFSRVSNRLQPTFQARMAGSSDVLTVPGESTLSPSGTMCYVPGLSTHDYRLHNAAKFVPAGSDIVVTFHYLTTGKAAIDRSKIGFTVTKTPPAKQFVELAPSAGRDLAIPPYESNYAAPRFELQILRDAELVWMWPHMHLRGKDITYTLIRPDGTSTIVLKVPKYDFNWQLGYLTSVKVPAGSRLRVDAHYDNSKGNRANPDPSAWVRVGKQSWEEMLTPAFGLVVDRNVSRRSLTSKFVAEDGG
jgi:hypothetical protein